MPARNIDDPEYSSYCNRVNENQLVKAFQKLKYCQILPFRKYLTPDSSILDIGCARGNLFRVLLSHGYTNLYGTDLTNELYPELNNLVKFHPGSILKAADLPSEQFDGVFLQSVLHHLPVDQLNVVAKHLALITKPGGVVLIYDTNRTSLCGRLFYDWFERVIPYMFRDAQNEKREQVIFCKEWPRFVFSLEKNGFYLLKHSSLWFYTACIARRGKNPFEDSIGL